VLFLEKWYGIREGSHGEKRSANGTSDDPTTQKELADQLNISVDTLKRAKKLATLPQEVQDAVEAGQISPSLAVRKLASLPEDQQIEVILDYSAKTQIIG